jgi:hypothetical protein
VRVRFDVAVVRRPVRRENTRRNGD